MENLLTYILQVNLLLSVVYLGYKLLLKKLTFYSLNRIYFVLGAIYAFVYPTIDIKQWLVEESAAAIPVLWEYIPFEYVEPSSASYSLYDFLLILIGLGVFIFIIKLLMQLFSLIHIHLNSRASHWQHFLFRDVIFPVVPFSFFNKIYLHKALHEEVELQDIFEHESIHVKGHHTLDVLLFEIVLIGCWYNPFVWLMRNAVRQNLEYLTDQQVLNKGVDRQTYQYSLLHVTQRGAVVGISNQFNFKTLKKRIMMMNKKRSSRLELSKYAFLLPIMLLAGASFTVSQAENKIAEVVDLAHETTLDVTLPKSIKEVEDLILAKDSLDKKDFKLPIIIETTGYLLDGRLVDMDEIKKIDPKDLESVVINSDTDFTKKYNKKTIVKFTTKEFSGTVGTPSRFTAISFDNNSLSFSGKSIVVPMNYNNEDFSVEADDFSFQAQSYPLLAPDFDRKALEKGNFYYQIDGKLVPLDEFLEFPRSEIAGVDIYKDKEEIKKKIGKANADGLFVMTSKKSNATPTVSGSQKLDGGVKHLKSKSEIEKGKSYLYEYDGRLISNEEFFKISDDDLPYILLISDKQAFHGLYAGKVANINDFEGVISARSVEADRKIKEEAKNVLIIVDGKVMGKGSESMKDLDPNAIKSMEVLKGGPATAAYGDQGKDGVILISTKSRNAVLAEGVQLDKAIVDNMKKPIQDLVFRRDENAKAPMYVLDGKELPKDFNFQSLNKDNIESISVLKGESATAAYGDKGKDGVIIIESKKK